MKLSTPIQLQDLPMRTQTSLIFVEGDWKVVSSLRHVRPAHECNGSKSRLWGEAVELVARSVEGCQRQGTGYRMAVLEVAYAPNRKSRTGLAGW